MPLGSDALEISSRGEYAKWRFWPFAGGDELAHPDLLRANDCPAHYFFPRGFLGTNFNGSSSEGNLVVGRRLPINLL